MPASEKVVEQRLPARRGLHNDLRDGIQPTFQSWLWIKNVFQPDSFGSTILPAIGDKLMAISPVGYSRILTQENIEAARTFLASSEYAAVAAQYGANAFTQIPLNFIIIKPVLTLPTSFATLFQYSNGLFLLPIFAAVSQFFMTKQLKDCETVVFVGGISPQLEGEEMPIEISGFKGGDRTNIELPKVQRNFLKALKEAGKKVVFVNCSGSAIALTPETESCDGTCHRS